MQRFDSAALCRALDAQRRSRALSWSDVAREAQGMQLNG
jgi:hypothetical protein